MNQNTVQITLQFKDDGTAVVVDQAKDKMKGFGDEAKKTQQSSESLGETWVGMTAKIVATSAAVYGAVTAISSFVKEAAEAEQTQNRLRFALESNGYEWEGLKSNVDQYTKSIMETTRFSENDARKALTNMMMYTQDYAKAQKAATLAMDMSIRTGHDLDSATHLIGMAITGNVEMLGRYIPQLRNLDTILGSNASMGEKAAYAMKILNEKFGGTAQADIVSYAGKVKQFDNQWKELKETYGSVLLPALGSVLDYLTNIVKATQRAGEATSEYRKRIAEEWTGFPTAFPSKAAFKVEEGMGEPTKPEEMDPFVRMFGITEREFNDRMELSKLSFQGWLNDRTREGDLFLADQQTIMDSILATKTGAEFTFPTEDILPDLMQITNQYGEILTVNKTYYDDIRDEKLAMAELLATVRMLKDATGAEFTYPTEDILPDWMVHPKTGKPVMVENWKNEVNQMQTIFGTFASNLSSAWSENMSSMLKGTETLKDGFKNMAKGMADAFLSSITKMIMNYALFGNMVGTGYGAGQAKTPSTGTGWLGIIGAIGNLFGLKEGGYLPGGFLPIKAFAGGGYANRPTLGMIGEGGEGEYIIPESKMGMGRTIVNISNYNTNINTMDAFTFRDFIKRNQGPILNVIEEDAKGPGTMRNVVSKLR